MRPARAIALTIPAVLAIAFPIGAHAQDSAAARPVATAIRRTTPVVLDGRLDDAAWRSAPPITHFTQQKPDEGKPAAQRTDVRFLYDDHALYIGARMYERDGAAAVTSKLTRRDDHPASDVLRIDLDPYHDRLNSLEFDVNPAGWRGDATNYDRSWDPVWEAVSRIDSLGWTAEIRIPFSQLRFSRDSIQTWGLNVTRITQRTQERDMWAFWRQNEAGGPAFFGTLTGLVIHARPTRLQLVPYGVVAVSRLAPGDPGNTLFRPDRTDLRAGVDLTYLPTSSLTLNATINPDFGQVEVDPAVVNLTAFETYFPERRPFFIEGANRFDYGQPGCNMNCGFGLNLFYSRRIGRPPEGASLAYAAGPYTDVPQNTTIVGAAKLTGRTESGYTVGMLDAVTRGASAPVLTSSGGRILQPVAPATNAFVGRVTREMHGGNVVLGGMLTSLYRNLTDPGLVSLLDRSATSGGADATISWDRKTYRLYTALAVSDVRGDPAAILRLQRSSARYFQRPDRSRGSNALFSSAYDSTATVLRGYGAIARFSKESGDWVWDINAADVSPGFETNDLGFLPIADWRWLNGSLGRQFTRPTRVYRNLTIMGGAEQQWNHDGDVTTRDAILFTRAQLANYWNVMGIVQYQPRTMSDRLTRGGPVVGQSSFWFWMTRVSTDPRNAVVLEASPNFMRSDGGSFRNSVNLSMTWRPVSNVSLTVGPAFSVSRYTDQYVQSIIDSTAVAFYGTRYVFSWIDQRSVSMPTRASVTFTPNLSLQLYAQPLIATGHYSNFEEFAGPRQVRKLVYGRDVGTISASGTGGSLSYTVDPDGAGPARSFTIANPDFNFRALRGTAVLRWEWRPGSTAYLVWTQTRDDVAPIGTLDLARDRAALFAAHPNNTILLKVSYWLGV